ncbi:alcohol oxidase [Trametes punicea]|nr:alcohol oxidase [Trametes punicea]
MAGFPEVLIQDAGVRTAFIAEDHKSTPTYDYIIVGGGTSGAVLASRLSEDPTVSVLVLEKGQVADTWTTRVPLLSANPTSKNFLGVKWMSVPQKHAGDRTLQILRGEVLGGCSRINGALYTRGTPGDYNRWEELGNVGWAYKDLESYFIKSESTQSHPASSLRGKTGPWNNRKAVDPYTVTSYINQALVRAGFHHVQDFNDPTAPAACTGLLDVVVDSSSYRHSTYRAFLPPELARERRSHLKVCTRAIVSRVQLDQSAGSVRATGVFFQSMDANYASQEYFARARKEVILCAGALVSPQILMLSGLGPKDHLLENGIGVVQDIPAVGSHLQDHLAMPIEFTTPISDSLQYLLSNPLRAILEFLKYIFLGIGALSHAFQYSSTFFPSRLLRDDLTIDQEDVRNFDTSIPDNRPDIEYMHIPIDCVGIQAPGKGAYTFLVTLIRPKSEGTIRLVSTDPRTPPAVDLGYLTSPDDFAPLRAGVRLALRVAKDVRKQGYMFDNLFVPEADSDEEIDMFIRKNLISCFHFTSTCRMGAQTHGDRPSVVDGELKVHGVQGLRVCDASVFPQIVGSHTMAPSVVVAEKCADMIKADHKG